VALSPKTARTLNSEKIKNVKTSCAAVGQN